MQYQRWTQLPSSSGAQSITTGRNWATYLGGIVCFLNAWFCKLHVGPASKPIFLVPGAFAMAQQNNFVRSFHWWPQLLPIVLLSCVSNPDGSKKTKTYFPRIIFVSLVRWRQWKWSEETGVYLTNCGPRLQSKACWTGLTVLPNTLSVSWKFSSPIFFSWQYSR